LRYEAPTSLDQATQILAGGGGAKVLAGGTDLLVQMKLGLREPALVVDVKRIPELMEITLGDSGLRLGAAVPGAVVTGHPQIRRLYPGFVEALGLIGSSQIQGRCSAGGNLCNASPAADSVCSMIVNRAVCNIAGAAGPRTVPVEDFATGPGSNCLAGGELLVSIDFPLPAPRSGDAYLRFIPRTEMDIAVCSAGVSLTLGPGNVVKQARVALGAVAPTVVLVPKAARAIVGTRLEDDALMQLSAACEAACSPIDDKRGTVEFRTEVAGVLARRAARIAYDRARGKR